MWYTDSSKRFLSTELTKEVEMKIPEFDTQGLYTAFKAKDARFDGRFFVGIASTGIYCRPVCRARMPKAENCSYYLTAAQAEQAGYRPCLLCRPELAPGNSVTDASKRLARRAARLLEVYCGSGLNLDELAGLLGCSSRHLRRIFAAEYQVTPVQYLQTCRLLLAKSLLTDTNLSVLEVAMAAGFGSLRRFNDLFQAHYRLSPTRLRKQVKSETLQNEVTLTLGYRPPYEWQQILGFLSARAIPGVEVVTERAYLRTVRVHHRDGSDISGWIRVSRHKHRDALNATVSASLLPVLPKVLARIRHLFDLQCDPEAVAGVLESMNQIRPGLFTKGVRVPGSFDAFELTVRAVLGQQITVRAAATLAGRLAETYGQPIETGIAGLTHTFPGPEAVLALAGPIEDHLGPLGIIARRARTIAALAEAFDRSSIDFDLCAQPAAEIEKMMAIPGIGAWTANYIAMRTMEWPDAFLAADHGVKTALASCHPGEIAALAEGWHPWGSYATVNLWNTLQKNQEDI